MKTLIPLSFGAVLLAAAACNDDPNDVRNGPTDDPATGGPPPAQSPLGCSTVTFARTADVDASPGGVWLGSLVDCADNTQQDYLVAMVGEDGRFRIYDGNDHLLAGVLKVEGDVFSGDGTDFAPPGVEYFSGPITDMFVEGTVIEGESLQGRWGTEWGNYGYFTFEYVQQSYERPTPLADLAGTWSLAANYSGAAYAGVWTVEPDGRFDGQDDSGCLQSGAFSLIDEAYSIVAVDFTVSGCALAGYYSGLALYEDLVDWWERSITISADDGIRALRIGLAIERP